ncbi:taperin [Limanda limanda]|uniref:taperin n=1 Tax=Limanda limanda TaxID=27771 RepID=UPI0029C6697A|nr:taperin [Limanda limanda]
MSGGGDVRVLRQEAGQESPRMPAWKREILERRKAKGGGSGGAGAGETSPGGGSGGAGAPEPSPGGGSGGAGPQRVNGEGSAGDGAQRDGGPSGGSGRNYTITTASQHFASNNKEPREEPPRPREEEEEESLVLQESLGPLEENPFIKLEKERRRRQDRDSSARPVQHILELYGSVPGIRTIRADNIIIIESDPDYFPEAGALKPGSKWQQNGVSSYSSLNDLLDQRGSAVTEIRAKEVVIYDTTLSRSEENLSTLGRPDLLTPLYPDSGEGPGRVSRMLQKFDSNYGKLQKKSRSTENLLELDSGRGPRLWAKPQPDLAPRPGSHPSSPCTPKPKPQPPASPQSVSSFRQRFEDTGGRGGVAASRDEPDRGSAKVTRERDWEAAEASPQPKVPCSPETRRARAETPSSPSVSSKAARSTPDFEIRPSPKPDLARIPDGDAQARALANLRLQSRNSFTVIPKRRPAASAAASSPVTPPGPVRSSPSRRMAEVPAVPTSIAMTPSVTPPNRKEEKEVVDGSSRPEPPPAAATSPASPPPSEPVSPSPAPSSPPPLVDQLPVTNIDDIEVEPSQRPPEPSPTVQRRKGNTFTVVPKHRADSQAQPGSPEPPQEASAEGPPGSTPPQAPYAHLGSLLKKRYPAVEEIEVIGGYQALARSCLSKTSSTGKKLKISFNESSLQSTYEYPSENTAWDSGDEDEDETLADEQPSMVGRIHIPRPSFTNSPTHSNNSNDLSSYIPKHSVDFSAWQEHKHDDGVYQEDATSSQTLMTEEVMLTPADSSSLSDYSSEPALYF